jgi:para-aminobenzoate synthetase component 1
MRHSLDLSASRLIAAVGSWPQPALLVSAPGFGERGRWSICTAYPRFVFEATGRRWQIDHDSGLRQSGAGDPLIVLSRLSRRFGLAGGEVTRDQDGCPFQGGLIGFLGYDLAPILERLPRRIERQTRLPDLRFALYDTAAIVDNLTGEKALHAWDLTGEGRHAAERRLRFWRGALQSSVHSSRRFRPCQTGPLIRHFDHGDYLKKVRRALDYIAAGDVFQVNLSQRFSAVGAIEPLDLFIRLCAASPAPFAALLSWNDLAVVSASPEQFYQVQGRTIVTCPIKGTRPRGTDAAQDRRLAAELARSAKDRAELTMIVDLERNDLGRVCRYGTVRVVDPLAVESFAQVHHLVATIEGRLRDEICPADVIRAVFPGGSITGAPKIRAMEIIDELEPARRGLYTGAIGYLSRGGTSNFNIAIRTMTVEGNRVSYQVGGGIVADSDPQSEYEETLHKGRGLASVIERKDLF